MGNRRLAWQRVELGQRPGGLKENRLCGKVGNGGNNSGLLQKYSELRDACGQWGATQGL